jgi:hypothetical protein
VDLADLVQSFSTQPGDGTYIVQRRAAATFVAGRPVQAAPTNLSIVASIQPASGKDLLRLPEGRRSNETRVLYTTTRLLTGDQGGPNEADQVTIDGTQWEVQHCESWVQPGGDMVFRCVAQAAL